MRVNSETYQGYRDRIEEILNLLRKSNKIPPVLNARIIDFLKTADAANKDGTLHRDTFDDRSFTVHNLRGGYATCLPGFISEIIAILYDIRTCGRIKDVYDNKVYNVDLKIDHLSYFDKEWWGNQVKTARFKGTVLWLEKKWGEGIADFLYIIDIDDRTLLRIKMSDYNDLLSQDFSSININDPKTFEVIDLSYMY